MRNKLRTCLTAWILAAALMLNLVPFTAYAADVDSGQKTVTESGETTEGQEATCAADAADVQNSADEEEISEPDIPSGDPVGGNSTDGTEGTGAADGDTETGAGDAEAIGAEDIPDTDAKEPEQTEEEGEELLAAEDETPVEGELVKYSGHIQTYGDKDAVSDGAPFGTTGESKRLEALSIQKGSALADIPGDIMYRVHVQSIGTMDWRKNGEAAGTTGQSKRLEAIQIYLTDELAEQYDIYYMTHIQKFGWTKWVKGSETESGWCGSSGLSLRLEAIKIQLVKKGEEAPADEGTVAGYITRNGLASVTYSGHQQTYGDLESVSNGAQLGVTGKSKRLEGLKISVQSAAGFSGSVQYRAHVQSIGWQGWAADGALAGTTGQAKRVEAIELKLSGDVAKYCDIWYRAHVQRYGWLGWAKNGQAAGTTSLSCRMEALQIQIVPKWLAAPGANSGYHVTMTPEQIRMQNARQSVYNQVGRNLYNCYMWCVNNIRYAHLGNSVPGGYTTTEWFALYGLEQHYGDCRTYAAAFYHLAKGLGYNARYVYGYVPRKGGGMIDHAWVEIDMNGTTYVFDANFQYETGGNGYHFTYGTSGTWRYSNYHYEN